MTKNSYLSKGDVYIVNGAASGVFNASDDASLQSVSMSRESLRNVLQEAGYNVMNFNGPELFVREFKVLHQLKLALPAVLLLDTRLHDWSGVELQSELNLLDHPVPMIFLGGTGDTKDIVIAMKQGAVDFLTQPFTRQEMCAVIDKAMALSVKFAARDLSEDELRVRLKSLTKRERDICFLMMRGYGNIEIAALNGSAAGTVKIHRSRILSKMGVNTLAGLLTQMSAFDHVRWHLTN